MNILTFPGGWYADAKADGRYVTFDHEKIHSSQGNFPKPPTGENPLFIVVSQAPGSPFKFAGKGGDSFDSWEFIGGQWEKRPHAYGNFSVIYDYNSILHLVNDVAVGVNGWRYCLPKDILITGDSTYGAVNGLNEWTDLSFDQDRSFMVGQGNQGGGVQVHIDGVNRWLHKGEDYAIRAHRIAGACAFAFYNVAHDGLTSFIVFATIDELRLLEKVEQPPAHTDVPHTDAPPHTDTPPHSDVPPHTDTPPHTDALKPMPPLKTSERYWLHPNIDSVDLVESLHADLATVDVFGLYAQWILDDSRWDRIDTLEGIRSQGVNLAIEMSCIMEGDPHGEGTRATFPQIAERVRSKGHRVNWLCMDEPITKAKKNFPTMGIDEVGFAIVKWMEEARKQFPGVKIVLIEAWPEIELDQMRKCLMVLDSWGQHLDGWHLDIDRRRAVKERKDMHAMVKKAKEYADQYKAALGVKFAGYSYLTDAEYRADVEAFAKDVAEKEHFAVDHICIQSWAERAVEGQHGPQDLPANLTQDGLFVTFGYIQESVFQ